MTLADELRPYVEMIKNDASCGNAEAKSIITLYRLHQTCPRDPAAPALCKAAFDSWLKGKSK